MPSPTPLIPALILLCASLLAPRAHCGFIDPPFVVARQNWGVYGRAVEAQISVPERLLAERHPSVPILRRLWLRGAIFDERLHAELGSAAPAAMVVQTLDRALSLVRDSGKVQDLTPLFEKYRLNETLPPSVISETLGLAAPRTRISRAGKTKAGNTKAGNTKAGNCDSEIGNGEIGNGEIGNGEIGNCEIGNSEIGKRNGGGGEEEGKPYRAQTALPFTAEPYAYTCDVEKMVRLGFPTRGPETHDELLSFFEKAVAAGQTPMLLPVGNSFNFASNLFVSMLGADFAREFASGTVPFDDARVRFWADTVQEWHDRGFVRVASEAAELTNFLRDGVVCTWTTAAITSMLNLTPEQTIVFVPPHWGNTGGRVHGTTFQLNIVLLAEADHAELALQNVEDLISKLQSNPGVDHTFRNVFILPEDRAGAGVYGERGPIYDLEQTLPGLDVLFIPAFVEVFMDKIRGVLFEPSVTKDYTSAPEPLSMSAVMESLDARRLELILSRTAAPAPSVASGNYDEPFTLALESPSRDAVVRFTRDGSDPAQGLVVSGPIAINAGETLIRAVAVAPQLEPSSEITLTYSVPESEELGLAYVVVIAGGAALLLVAAVAVILRFRRGAEVPAIPAGELCFEEILAFGSRGIVYRATWRGTPVAVKLYLNHEQRELALKGKLLEGSGALSSALLDSKGGHASLASRSKKYAAAVSSGGGGIGNSVHRSRNNLKSHRSGVAVSVGLMTGGSDGSAQGGGGAAAAAAASPSSATAGAGADATSGWGGRGARTQARRLWSGIVRELKTIASMRSPHIVSVFGTVDLGRGRRGTVMELMAHGSLYDALANASVALGARRRLEIALGAARGLATLHAQRPRCVLHRDFKSLNVLLGAGFDPKVSDFDLAVRCPRGKSEARFSGSSRAIGTTAWAAPEVLGSRGETHSTAADVYSFGVVLWEICSRQEPYEMLGFSTADEVAAFVRSGKRLAIPSSVSDDVAQVITDCWAHIPEARPSIEEVATRLALILADTPADPDATGGSAQSLVCARAIAGDLEVKALQKAVLAGSPPPPIAVPSVSVIFTDIVGFTALSASIDPVHVASMLTRLFSAFDEVLARHGGYLYKTVGDCYIAIFPDPTEDDLDTFGDVGQAAAAAAASPSITAAAPLGNGSDNPPTPSGSRFAASHKALAARRNTSSKQSLPGSGAANTVSAFLAEGAHPVRAVLAALDLVRAAARTAINEEDLSAGTVSVRAGVHTGPVAVQMMDISGVEFLGDTMNLASRLETSSEPGKVHLSQDTAKAMREDGSAARNRVSVVPRSGVHLKGKGEMATFFAGKVDSAATPVTPVTPVQNFAPIDLEELAVPGAAEASLA